MAQVLGFIEAYWRSATYWLAVDAFPLTGSGKIQKFVLRDRFVSERSEGR